VAVRQGCRQGDPREGATPLLTHTHTTQEKGLRRCRAMPTCLRLPTVLVASSHVSFVGSFCVL
jgi:hypothetical protein